MPRNFLTKMSVLSGVFVFIGMWLGSFIAVPYSFNKHQYYWIICYAAGALFPIIRFFYLVCYSKTETSAYYVKNHMFLEARYALYGIYPFNSQFGFIEDYEQIIDRIVFIEKNYYLSENKKEQKIQETELRTRVGCKFKREACIGVFLYFVQDFSGIICGPIYSSLIFKMMGAGNLSVWLSSVWGFTGMISYLISLTYVDKIPRRFLIVFGGILNCIFMF